MASSVFHDQINEVSQNDRLRPVHPNLARKDSCVFVGDWMKRTRTISSIHNHCSYPHSFFASLNPKGEVTATIVIRATFRIMGNALEVAAAQHPVRLADQFYGDPLTSSLRAASDLAIYKPRGDVVFIDPIARSTSLAPMPHWSVSVRVSDKVDCEFTISGVTKWRRRFGIWQLSPPKPCRRVPIFYELSAGSAADNPSSKVTCPAKRQTKMVANGPRVFSNTVRGGPDWNSPKLTGLGPLAPHWKSRLTFAGTYNDVWTSLKWPLLPDDFNYEFFNCAHPDLRANSFFDGNEVVSIAGMCRSGLRQFQLPALPNPGIAMSATNSLNRYYATCNLDTIEIDMNREEVSLIWRSAFEPPTEPVTAEVLPNLPEECHNAA